ncbi:capsid protein [Duwamo virus]|uniref:capsid protein n=1 Tax=Duwamo virus TaxID=1888317 RepID=UPI00083EB813|nr:capsid protein [Duwamo virus]AOC55072.1 capsid protein [Duwamo virus]
MSSTSHIPQPAAGATDEVFDSTSATAVQPTVSRLGIPAGPPQEIPIHTGQVNTYDASIHQQWVPTDSITWTVSQPSGTLLWFKPIHPTFSNALLAYLSRIYNAWGGALDYKFKIAGTGFHAGAIAIVRIPPNRNPSEFTTPQSWGAFEYMVIDPKTLETISVGISDQRPIAYHYFPYNGENPLSFGGWIAMYVLIPLNTSSSGSQTISIQSFCKPAEFFQYSQLIMPSENISADPFPSEFAYAFDFTTAKYCATAPLYCDQVTLEANSVTQSFYVANCYSTGGDRLTKWMSKGSKFPDVRDTHREGKTQMRALTDLSDETIKVKLYFKQDYYPIALPASKENYVSLLTYSSENVKNEAWHERTWTALYSEDNVAWQCATAATDIVTDTVVSIQNAKFVLDPSYTDNTFSTAVTGESILHFENTISKVKSIQTEEMAALFSTGRVKQAFYGNMCVLFTMISVDEDLPIGYAKLYQEGFLSIRVGNKQVVLKPSNLRLKFSGFIARTDPIPSSAEYNKNMYMVRALSRN